MTVLDDVSKLVEMVRRYDRTGLVDDLLDELIRVRDKVQDLFEEVSRLRKKVRSLLAENRRLRERLRERIQEEAESLPYEGIYWFDSGELSRVQSRRRGRAEGGAR